MKLLESYLLGRWDHKGTDDEVPPYKALDSSRSEIIEGLLACSLVTDIAIREANDEGAASQSEYLMLHNSPLEWHDLPIVRKCHESALRVLINLSHDNETWSSALLDNELTVPTVVRFIVSSHSQIAGTGPYEDKIHVSDRLCLALGLLTNLVQADERAKDLVRETRTSDDPVMFCTEVDDLTVFSRTCPEKRSCIQSCHCSNRATALSSLLSIFLDHRINQSKSEADDADHEMEPIIQGHTAVLFGLLMRDNLQNQTSILDLLPGDTNKQKLGILVDTAREFVEFYGEVMARLARGRKGGDAIGESQATETEEEENDHVDEGSIVDDGGEKTARDVVAFLELLSDST